MKVRTIQRKPIKPEYATWVAIQKRGPICRRWRCYANFRKGVHLKPSWRHFLIRDDTAAEFSPTNTRCVRRGIEAREGVHGQDDADALARARWPTTGRYSPLVQLVDVNGQFEGCRNGMIQINAAARLPPTMAHGKTAFHHRSGRDCGYRSQLGCTRLRRVFHLGRTLKAAARQSSATPPRAPLGSPGSST